MGPTGTQGTHWEPTGAHLVQWTQWTPIGPRGSPQIHQRGPLFKTQFQGQIMGPARLWPFFLIECQFPSSGQGFGGPSAASSTSGYLHLQGEIGFFQGGNRNPLQGGIGPIQGEIGPPQGGIGPPSRLEQGPIQGVWWFVRVFSCVCVSL